MSFRIGQRVRLVRSLLGFVKVGATGTVIGELETCWAADWGTWTGQTVGWDGIGTRCPKDGRVMVTMLDQMEPIDDYDGNTVTTWAQSVWKPKQVAL